jgi:hypothetical protein
MILDLARNGINTFEQMQFPAIRNFRRVVQQLPEGRRMIRGCLGNGAAGYRDDPSKHFFWCATLDRMIIGFCPTFVPGLGDQAQENILRLQVEFHQRQRKSPANALQNMSAQCKKFLGEKMNLFGANDPASFEYAILNRINYVDARTVDNIPLSNLGYIGINTSVGTYFAQSGALGIVGLARPNDGTQPSIPGDAVILSNLLLSLGPAHQNIINAALIHESLHADTQLDDNELAGILGFSGEEISALGEGAASRLIQAFLEENCDKQSALKVVQPRQPRRGQ